MRKRGLVESKTPLGERDRWRTPDSEFAKWERRYGPFTLDAAADESNHKTPLWLGPGSGREDALTVDWCNYDGTPAVVWCNPPYSIVGKFVTKASVEARSGRCSATLLLPSTTDVRWFHEQVWDGENDTPYPGVKLSFSKGRIRFNRPNGEMAGQPQGGSMIVHFQRGRF